MSSESNIEQLERRAHARFPVELSVRYRLLGRRVPQHTGHGTTVNMSSHGILFVDDQTPRQGTKVEVVVDWPVKLDGTVPLHLIVVGSIVRLEKGLVALAIKHHEFRTSKSRDLQPSTSS